MLRNECFFGQEVSGEPASVRNESRGGGKEQAAGVVAGDGVNLKLS